MRSETGCYLYGRPLTPWTMGRLRPFGHAAVVRRDKDGAAHIDYVPDADQERWNEENPS